MRDFVKYIDTDYSVYITESLIKFVSNPDLGYRTSGSQAEKDAADFLLAEYEKMGLQNCRKEPVTVDTFEFKRGDLLFKDADGNDVKALMSMYQTRCHAKDEEIEIIYVGKGTDADYEGVDAEEKFLLIDINMLEDWWVNWPLCQAITKKAAGIIVVNVGGYCSYSEEVIGTQDLYGPADIPAFSMSVADGKKLKAAIEAGGGSVHAILNAEAEVEKDGISYCVIGEIPGQIDEVVYIIGHYDAYFRAFDDNSAGIGCMLGIIKAMLDSGYKPNRTIRVIAHGAEEWGKENCKYDWSRGAWVLTQQHPEWAENGFALVNMDGNTINDTATVVQVRTCYEMAEAIAALGKTIEGKRHEIETNQPIWTWTESIMYNYLGIPTIETFYKDVDFWGFYHSTHDTKEIHNYSDREYRSSHIIYGSYLQIFDEMRVRPFDFTATFHKFMESLQDYPLDKGTLVAAAEKALAVAEKLKAFDAAALPDDEVHVYNQKVSKMFQFMNKNLYGINCAEEFDFAHVRYMSNVNNLKAAIAGLEAGKTFSDIKENLAPIDLTYYMFSFDKETCDFLIDQVLGAPADNTWATGFVETVADMWDVVRSLMAKEKAGDADLADEIATLKSKLAEQESLLAAKADKVVKSIEDMTAMMEGLM